MPVKLLIAVVVTVLALVLYTVGIWRQRSAKTIRPVHLWLFWLGLVCDITGSLLMGTLAGGFSLTIHGINGLLAVLLMVVTAVRATMIYSKKDEEAARRFPRFSIPVWVIWVLSFLTGVILSMGK